MESTDPPFGSADTFIPNVSAFLNAVLKKIIICSKGSFVRNLLTCLESDFYFFLFVFCLIWNCNCD